MCHSGDHSKKDNPCADPVQINIDIGYWMLDIDIERDIDIDIDIDKGNR
jgi:hypothetical protein